MKNSTPTTANARLDELLTEPRAFLELRLLNQDSAGLFDQFAQQVVFSGGQGHFFVPNKHALPGKINQQIAGLESRGGVLLL